MRKEILPIVALGVWVFALPVMADELAMPEPSSAPAAAISLPAKGTTMATVQSKFGAPATKHPTVGGGSPRQPPITRWDYPEFTVVFENDKVIDAVIPGAPPKLATRQGLQQVDVPPAMPSVTFETPMAAPVDVPVDAPAEPAMDSAPEAEMPMYETPPTAEPAAAPMDKPAAEKAPAPMAESAPHGEPKPLP